MNSRVTSRKTCCAVVTKSKICVRVLPRTIKYDFRDEYV